MMKTNHVILAVETPIPFTKMEPWWLVEFYGPCDVRWLPTLSNPARGLVDILSEPRPRPPTLRWVVHARRDKPPEPYRWERYLVGLQTTQGIENAPAEYLSWGTIDNDTALIHVFRLGPGEIATDGAPFRVRPLRSDDVRAI